MGAGLPLACPLAWFLYFARCADAAMDKGVLDDMGVWHGCQAKAVATCRIALCIAVPACLAAAATWAFGTSARRMVVVPIALQGGHAGKVARMV